MGLNDAETPPEAVASLGSKRLFPKEKLKALKQMRRRMHTECTAYGGIKFLGGYAVPETKAATLATALDKHVVPGNALRDDLLRNFDATVKAWHQENPQWAHIMRAGTPEKESVGNRIRFGYHGFVVGTPNNATVVVVGDVDERALLEAIVGGYGHLPPATLPDLPVVVEPPQERERVRRRPRPIASDRVLLGWKAVGQAHPDWAAEDVIVVGDKAYLAENNAFDWSNLAGKVGVVDLLTQTYGYEVDLGAD